MRLVVDSSMEALQSWQPQESFPIMVALDFDQEPTLEQLLFVQQVQQRINGVEGVLDSRSAVSLELPYATEDDVFSLSLAQQLELAPEQVRPLWRQRRDDPFVAGRLVDATGTTLGLIIDAHGESVEARDRVSKAVVLTLEQALKNTGVRWSATSGPRVSGVVGDLMLGFLRWMLPLTVLSFALILWIAFRSLSIAVGGLLSVLIAIVWTLALPAMLSWTLNLVTIIVVPLVMALCFAYVMHIVGERAENRDMASTLQSLKTPFVLTVATTVVGLLALAVSDMRAIREFAVTGATGVMAAALSAWLLMPLVLNWSGRTPKLSSWIDRGTQSIATRVGAIVSGHSDRVMRGGLVLFAACIGASLLIEPGAQFVRDLPEDEPVRQDYERIAASLGLGNNFQIQLTGSGEDAMLNPGLLRQLDRLQLWLLEQPEVSSAESLVDYVKRAHQVMTDGRPESAVVPSDQLVIKQILLLAGSEDMYRRVDMLFSRTSLNVWTPLVDTAEVGKLLDRIQDYLDQNLNGVEAQLVGQAVEHRQSIEQLTGGQLRSLSISALAIFLLLSGLFASWRSGLLSMLPNVLPVAFYFGLLGITGTQLGPATSLVACIVLGIAVDDTLHLMVRFQHEARRTANEKQAANLALSKVIKPISLSTVAVSTGFLILCLSPFESQAIFGLLSGITLLAAWASDLLIAPVVASRTSVVTLWDLVSLNLGHSPETSLPLMQGMSRRQAKLLASSTELREVQAGEVLVRQGDEGDAMYVLIDGDFEVLADLDEGQQLKLASLSRGETVGEAGFFRHRRTATVRASSAGRVLTITEQSLDKLNRRHPRIASLAYRNLNRIQAERLDRSSERYRELAATTLA